MSRLYKSLAVFSAISAWAYACSNPELAFQNDPSFLSGKAGAFGEGGAASSAAGTEAGVGNDTGVTDAGIVLSDGSAGGPADAGADSSEAGESFAPMDASYPDVTFTYTPSNEDRDACASVQGAATESQRPMDIIISIDNSGSMNSEIKAVQQRVNEDFAQIIEDSGIDFRVIMVSRYGHPDVSIGGSNNPVCIGPPLGNAECETPFNYPMLQNNPPIFYHHSTDIESRNMWCRLLDSFDAADEVEDPQDARGSGDPFYPWESLAPNGWQAWLREGSFKVFIGITDDATGGDGCNIPDTAAGARQFDRLLRTLSPEHFGAYNEDEPDQGRNYAWYSIVGMRPNNPPTKPWPPEAPIQEPQTCNAQDNQGVRSGVAYQHLSVMTGALRYPSCLTNDFDAIFNAVAQGVIEFAAVPCEYGLPDVDGIINFDDVQVSYQPGDGGPSVAFDRADDEADCSGEQYYFNDNMAPSQIRLCSDACGIVQADDDASINIELGCLGT